MSRFNKIFIVIAVTLFANACGGSNKMLPPPQKCSDANPGFITIVINYRGDKIIVPQDPQIAVPGDVLQFILRGEDSVLVATSGKNAAAGWLNGSGKKHSHRPDTDRFLVCVPRDLFDGEPDDVKRKEYSYNVDAESRAKKWPRLDPIVIIDRM